MITIQSYKNDKNGNPILINTFLYELDKARFNASNISLATRNT